MNTQVDSYFTDGCRRCPLGSTPQCKVNKWPEVLRGLRALPVECGLTEESKWGVPCYTFQNKNVLIISAFNDYCVMSFFKGALLEDAHGLLEKPGPNTQGARIVSFTDVQEIQKLESTLKTYIYEAIEVEKAGLTVAYEKNPEPMPDELLEKFEEDPVLKGAFDALTTGKKRGYIIHFSQPKQAKTRVSRIQKCRDKILKGKGFNDR